MNIKEMACQFYGCIEETIEYNEVLISIPTIGEYEIARIWQEDRPAEYGSYNTVIIIEARKK